jgi:rubrerythrin
MDDFSRTLVEAMQAENDGFHHYQAAADRTSDSKAKQAFTQLAQEEMLHHKVLEEMLLAHRNQTLDSLKPIRLKAKVDSGEQSPIFSPDFKSRIADKHFEMSAISIGILLEQNSIEQYKKYRRQSSTPHLKKLFNALIRWEGEHLEALVKQQQFLQQDYWVANSFAPF